MNHRYDDLYIRPLKEEDAYFSVEWRNNPAIWTLTRNSPKKVISIQDELNWINKVLLENNSFRFAIIYKQKYVGNVQLTDVQNNESYFGIFLGNTQFWGQGIGKRVTKLILDFAFLELFLNKVKLRVRINHKVAIKLYESIGFNEVKRDLELIHMEINKNIYK